jgi:hypothetical protein
MALLCAGSTAAFATRATTPPRLAPAVPGATSYRCTGAQLKLFDNSNGQGIMNGASAPTFSTKGHAYCLSQIATYHWNNGTGATPGTIGLTVVSGLGGAGNVLGPLAATGSSGQGGAQNVNWTASAATPIVLDGSYSCLDSDPSTWSQNQASGGHGFCTVYVQNAVATKTAKPAKPTYTCIGSQVKLFDNSNGGGVQNGGSSPVFNTYGTPGVTAWCLNSITTYHWNNGHGSKPGMIGLGPLSFGAIVNPVAPRHATGSSGQGGAPNVNWTVDYPNGKSPVVISGVYTCRDSDPATWAHNQLSRGGFCTVYATPAYVSNFMLPSGTRVAQPPPPSQPPPTSTHSGGRIRCFTGTLSTMLLYPIHVAAGSSGLLLLHCAIKTKDGFQGRLTPSSMFVIPRGCGPFWTYPFASGNPPPPVFLHYTGQPNAPCATGQEFIPFAVTGPWRIDYQTNDISSRAPLRDGAYGVFIRYPGGDIQAENTLNIP